eukprot:SAG22_NODE_188_length_15821_cov_38.313319_17_plen_127_part_00
MSEAAVPFRAFPCLSVPFRAFPCLRVPFRAFACLPVRFFFFLQNQIDLLTDEADHLAEKLTGYQDAVRYHLRLCLSAVLSLPLAVFAVLPLPLHPAPGQQPSAAICPLGYRLLAACLHCSCQLPAG